MDTAAHWLAVRNGQTGIKKYTDVSLSNMPFMAAKLDAAQFQTILAGSAGELTVFEQLAAWSARKALDELDGTLDLGRTAFILSTTKGNIELLGHAPDDRLLLHHSAKMIANAIGITSKPFV